VTTRLGVVALAGPRNGGTYQYTLSTLQALRHTTGFEITVYGDPEDREFAAFGYPVRRFAEPRLRRLSLFAAHKLHVRLADPFASEDMLLAPIYSLALLHSPKPFAFTLHDLQEKYYPANFHGWQRAWRDSTNRDLLARAARIICESEYVKSDIVRFYGAPRERIDVMPAPPQEQFVTEPGQAVLDDISRRLALPDRFLFYPAQFWPHKNHLRLIEAFRDALPDAGDVHLVLTGKPYDEYQAVMAAIAAFGLRGRVRHLGYLEQQDIQALYRLATALVMPSLFESISIPVYEAFQVGTPVAASNILALPEQVGDAGLLFDPTSVASIKAAMLEILRNPAAARERANRGRARMAAMTPERYGAQLQVLLEAMASQRR
jgi:glycosyltransferase involved in cell wall biosynthesis